MDDSRQITPLTDPLDRAVRQLEEAEKTGASEVDLSHLGLGPVLRPGWRGWQVLAGLHRLTKLDLSSNGIVGIPTEGWNALARLSQLRYLGLDENQLAEIPAEGWQALAQLTALMCLDISENRLTSISAADWEALGRIRSLSRLYLDDNRIQVITPEGWAILSSLQVRCLGLSRNPLAMSEADWEALGQLKNLGSLSIQLGGSEPILPEEAWRALGRLTRLWHIAVDSPVSEIGWKMLGELSDLEYLNLVGCKMVLVPAVGWETLSHLSKLTHLFLSWCGMESVPDDGWRILASLANLETLWLAGNKLTTISAQGWRALSCLPKLKQLDLSRNQINEIPLDAWDEETGFPKLASFNLSKNPLPDDLLAAASRGTQSLFAYLAAARLSAAHPRTVKLMLLGEPASGKTTLVEALKSNASPCDPNRPETIGVNVQRIEKESPTGGRPLYLATWDFAGQHMEYATHQFFLRSGGIYLIVWKARLGSDYGQRDLWYWLELLKMRVKDPEFLLVTTHTSSTPAVLDVAEVQRLYPGFKGHFEVELSDLTGVAALEQKILELALASPSLKAVWPSPWLKIRDAIRGMRAASPYISAADFWTLCAHHGVTEPRAQRDLADQLDKLGEIVYYPSDALSRFVVLDPTWVTELVASVVRDKKVRGQRGALHTADLDRIWGNLPGDVRIHIENLMDEYDLVYKASLQGQTDFSIVVEALPLAPEDIRTADISAGRPQMEMIYRFPTLVRHLPPGVPTWAFARSQRYIKPDTGLWRNAGQFVDAGTNSEAIVISSEVDREVRVRVAADYPPYFFGVLDSILRDTFRRYPGAQPESRIPCPCRPGCKYGHPRETVLKRKRDGKSDITCPVSGEDVPIETLLAGFSRVETEAGVRAVLAEMRRQLSAIQNAQNEELLRLCPSIFTLAPAKQFTLLSTYLEYATKDEELELTLYCEWEKEWHPTEHSVDRFQPEQEWFASLKEHWSEFAAASKRVAPLVGLGGALIGLPAIGPAAKEIAEGAEKMSAASDQDAALAKELRGHGQAAVVSLESRHLLERLIRSLDTKRGGVHPEFGGLRPYILKEDGRLLWLCPQHREEYESKH